MQADIGHVYGRGTAWVANIGADQSNYICLGEIIKKNLRGTARTHRVSLAVADPCHGSVRNKYKNSC